MNDMKLKVEDKLEFLTPVNIEPAQKVEEPDLLLFKEIHKIYSKIPNNIIYPNNRYRENIEDFISNIGKNDLKIKNGYILSLNIKIDEKTKYVFYINKIASGDKVCLNKTFKPNNNVISRFPNIHTEYIDAIYRKEKDKTELLFLTYSVNRIGKSIKRNQNRLILIKYSNKGVDLTDFEEKREALLKEVNGL